MVYTGETPGSPDDISSLDHSPTNHPEGIFFALPFGKLIFYPPIVLGFKGIIF